MKEHQHTITVLPKKIFDWDDSVEAIEQIYDTLL
jgi:hypothetical protein